jgi:hypothetical protein
MNGSSVEASDIVIHEGFAVSFFSKKKLTLNDEEYIKFYSLSVMDVELSLLWACYISAQYVTLVKK